MSTLDAQIAAVRQPSAAGLQTLYAGTLLLSASLFFSLEPMFSKMILPVLGGSASVWSVAMVVFQALLLAGYVYAWVLTRFLSLRLSALVHALLLALATLCLPIGIASGFRSPPEHAVALWLVGLFVTSTGLPCFALSASAPLLQAWFAQSGHANANNPYPLYRASNVGSFAVLLAYPFFIEPALGLNIQARVWTWAYWALVVAVCTCGFIASRWQPEARGITAPPRAVTSWKDRWLWIALGFIPSGLLVAVTAHIATDVASGPFLWVLPLALYLLTFILAFAERPMISERLVLLLQPLSIAVLALLLLWSARAPWTIAFAGNLGAFFVASTVCQLRLYRSRPAAGSLTEFYALFSFGGVLGGIFAGLLAPVLFRSVLEYPLLAFAAVLIRSDVLNAAWAAWKREIALIAGLCAVLATAGAVLPSSSGYFVLSVMALSALLAFSWNSPARLTILAGLVLAGVSVFNPWQSAIAEARSFYGIYKVVDVEHGRFRVLFHGTTAHGAEAIGGTARGKPEPLAYYHRGGSFAEAIEAVRLRDGGRLRRVALVGLGLGALTCYAQEGEQWTVYELDPLIVRIAGDTKLFRSFSTCGNHMPVVIGDGRLTLRKSAPLDLLLLDIFSSDSVPTHMLTAEAFALYRLKLAEHGAIAFNISNHNMELASVVAQSAAVNGMVAAVRTDPPLPPETFKFRTEVAVVARSRADLDALRLGAGWRILSPDPTFRLWTDDYSDVVAAILRRSRS